MSRRMARRLFEPDPVAHAVVRIDEVDETRFPDRARAGPSFPPNQRVPRLRTRLQPQSPSHNRQIGLGATIDVAPTPYLYTQERQKCVTNIYLPSIIRSHQTLYRFGVK